MNIYVASSWRNLLQPTIVHALRRIGHTVYDFRNPPAGTGFDWAQIDPSWQDWDADAYRLALQHPIAKAGYDLGRRSHVGRHRNSRRLPDHGLLPCVRCNAVGQHRLRRLRSVRSPDARAGRPGAPVSFVVLTIATGKRPVIVSTLFLERLAVDRCFEIASDLASVSRAGIVSMHGPRTGIWTVSTNGRPTTEHKLRAAEMRREHRERTSP